MHLIIDPIKSTKEWYANLEILLQKLTDGADYWGHTIRFYKSKEQRLKTNEAGKD